MTALPEATVFRVPRADTLQPSAIAQRDEIAGVIGDFRHPGLLSGGQLRDCASGGRPPAQVKLSC